MYSRAGTLPSSTQYSATYSYDTLNRLTSSPAGSYTYGDSAHLDAATSVGSGYTASYDASGNMLCRAPSSSATCSGTATGQQLAYDSEGRLASWQNAPTSPTATDGFLYDGEGHRVLQQSTSNGTTTTTTYVGSLEEVTTSGTTTTTTVYYPGGFAESVNGTISYLASGGLGSPEVALDASGNPEASALYAPFGGGRYTSGTMPTDLGFTGQHSDASTTGLDYYNARSYDPTIGQFASADTSLLGGLNRYAYVGGNPETFTDPSGHFSIGGLLSQVGQAVAGTWDQGVVNLQAAGGSLVIAASTAKTGGSLTDVLGSLLRAGADLGGAALDFGALALSGFTVSELLVPLAIGAVVGTALAAVVAVANTQTLCCATTTTTQTATGWQTGATTYTNPTATTTTTTTIGSGTITGAPSVPSAPSIATTGTAGSLGLGLTFATGSGSGADSDEYDEPIGRQGKAGSSRHGGPGEDLPDKVARSKGLKGEKLYEWGDWLELYKEGRGMPGNRNFSWRELEKLLDRFLDEEG